jgi:hypothetical protein
MGFQACCGRSGRRLLTKSCVIAALVLAGACSRGASEGGDQRGVPPDAIKIDDVYVDSRASGLIVHYRTRTSSGDCKAQAAEMPRVWDLL